jgi:hypothetical protein
MDVAGIKEEAEEYIHSVQTLGERLNISPALIISIYMLEKIYKDEIKEDNLANIPQLDILLYSLLDYMPLLGHGSPRRKLMGGGKQEYRCDYVLFKPTDNSLPFFLVCVDYFQMCIRYNSTKLLSPSRAQPMSIGDYDKGIIMAEECTLRKIFNSDIYPISFYDIISWIRERKMEDPSYASKAKTIFENLDPLSIKLENIAKKIIKSYMDEESHLLI